MILPPAHRQHLDPALETITNPKRELAPRSNPRNHANPTHQSAPRSNPRNQANPTLQPVPSSNPQEAPCTPSAITAPGRRPPPGSPHSKKQTPPPRPPQAQTSPRSSRKYRAGQYWIARVSPHVPRAVAPRTAISAFGELRLASPKALAQRPHDSHGRNILGHPQGAPSASPCSLPLFSTSLSGTMKKIPRFAVFLNVLALERSFSHGF